MPKKRVAIKEIESELERLWEILPSEEKVKAALFTLIVYIEDPATREHTDKLLKHILGRYPCRIIILEEREGQGDVEVSVSLESVGGLETSVTCDQIQICFSSEQKEEIPFLVLPHLISNVPVCMLWKGQPSPTDTVYTILKGTLDRLVIDPANLEQGQFASELWEEGAFELIDLKWASITGWRRLLAKVLGQFPFEELRALDSFQIQVADGSHPNGAEPVSALYLNAWLASILEWEDKGGAVTPVEGSPYSYGTVLGVELATKGGYKCKLALEASTEFVRVEASSPDVCEVPCSDYLGPFRREEIFAKELFRERSSSHYRNMLKHLPWPKVTLTT